MSKGNAGSIAVPCDACGTILWRRPSSLHGHVFCNYNCHNGYRRTTLRLTSFWTHVQKTDGCWLWTGAVDKDGYGKCLTAEKAHRFSWKLHYGPIADGLMVCHHCDTPPCVRPDHLF